MSATPETAGPATRTPVASRELELYETAMCCQTGVCGPSVNEQLLTVREDLRWAEAQGASVARHNLTSDPDAFVASPEITGLMQAFGESALPVLVVDGEIRLHGRYPTRDDLAAALQATRVATAEPIAEPNSPGCCSPGTNC